MKRKEEKEKEKGREKEEKEEKEKELAQKARRTFGILSAVRGSHNIVCLRKIQDRSTIHRGSRAACW